MQAHCYHCCHLTSPLPPPLQAQHPGAGLTLEQLLELEASQGLTAGQQELKAQLQALAAQLEEARKEAEMAELRLQAVKELPEVRGRMCWGQCLVLDWLGGHTLHGPGRYMWACATECAAGCLRAADNASSATAARSFLHIPPRWKAPT